MCSACMKTHTLFWVCDALATDLIQPKTWKRNLAHAYSWFLWDHTCMCACTSCRAADCNRLEDHEHETSRISFPPLPPSFQLWHAYVHECKNTTTLGEIRLSHASVLHGVLTEAGPQFNSWHHVWAASKKLVHVVIHHCILFSCSLCCTTQVSFFPDSSSSSSTLRCAPACWNSSASDSNVEDTALYLLAIAAS